MALCETAETLLGASSDHIGSPNCFDTWLASLEQTMLIGMPGGDSSSAEVGGDAGGFRVTGTPQAALRIEVWGYWSPEIASAFARDAAAVSQKLAPAALFTLDAKQLKPQGAEGQEALRALFRALAPVPLAKGTVVASNVMTVMQLTRLLRECGVSERLVFG